MDRRMERDPGMCSTLSWGAQHEPVAGPLKILVGKSTSCSQVELHYAKMTVLPSRGISDPEKRMGERDGQDEADCWLCV